MQVWTWNSPAFEPCDSLPVSDRGFRYGMAVFESVRVYHGVPLFWEQHLRRLRRACLDREFQVDPDALHAVAEQLRVNGKDGFARIYVTAGDGGVADPAAHCRIYLLLEDRAIPTTDGYRVGILVEAYLPIFGGLKTANYWANVDALQRAMRSGKDEALLFNEHAELISSCLGNVFLVKDGQVKTPALPSGARDGVLREWVLSATTVRECSLFLDDVRGADEIFLTNSWVGVIPVSRLEERIMPTCEVATRLRAELTEAIAAQVP